MDGVVVHDVASSLQDLVMMEKGNRILVGGVCKQSFVFRITPGIYFSLIFARRWHGHRGMLEQFDIGAVSRKSPGFRATCRATEILSLQHHGASSPPPPSLCHETMSLHYEYKCLMLIYKSYYKKSPVSVGSKRFLGYKFCSQHCRCRRTISRAPLVKVNYR